MDVREELRSLAASAPRTAPDDGVQVYRRGRRRVVRRRAGAGATGLALVALLVAVAWPGTVPGGVVIENEIVDEPDAEEPVDPTPSPDEDSGGDDVEEGAVDDRAFAVGEATVVVPEGFTIETLAPEDETPCLRQDTSPTTYIAADGAPFQAAPCDLETEPSTTSVLVTPLSTIPPAWLPGHADVDGQAPPWEPIDLGGAAAERVDDEPNGVLVVRSEELDLYLEVAGAELDPGLVDELLDSIGPRGSADDDSRSSSGVPPLDDEASTEDRIVEEETFGLTLTDVRVGTHDGFDRVTFEVEGDGQLGYNVTVDDAAIQHGSGNEVEVEGDGVVTVALRGMYLPPDRPAGVDAFDQERVGPPAGAGAVTELLDSGVYEGHHLWFIGTTEQVPVRVVRYEDPQRLVIDVLHP